MQLAALTCQKRTQIESSAASRYLLFLAASSITLHLYINTYINQYKGPQRKQRLSTYPFIKYSYKKINIHTFRIVTMKQCGRWKISDFLPIVKMFDATSLNQRFFSPIFMFVFNFYSCAAVHLILDGDSVNDHYIKFYFNASRLAFCVFNTSSILLFINHT